MKKAFFYFLSLAFMILLFLPVVILAQDSTVVDSTGGGGGGGGLVLSPTLVLVGSIILGIYEVVVRYLPTAKNYSILGWLIKIIQVIVPNKPSEEALKKAAETEKKGPILP